MNWKTAGLTIVATLSLTACGNNGDETGQGVNDNGVQQTRFNTTTDYPNDGINTRRNGELLQNRDNNTDTYRGMFNNTRGDNSDLTGNNDNNFTRDRINNRNITNQDNQDNNQNNRYEVADKVANRIASEVKDVDRAYVLTTDNNAYVAAELNRGTNGNGNDDEISDELKKEISQVVKDVDKDIDNVYVSTNPDFVNLTNNYIKDVNNGEPIEGLFNQFGEMIERIFPQGR